MSFRKHLKGKRQEICWRKQLDHYVPSPTITSFRRIWQNIRRSARSSQALSRLEGETYRILRGHIVWNGQGTEDGSSGRKKARQNIRMRIRNRRKIKKENNGLSRLADGLRRTSERRKSWHRFTVIGLRQREIHRRHGITQVMYFHFLPFLLWKNGSKVLYTPQFESVDISTRNSTYYDVYQSVTRVLVNLRGVSWPPQKSQFKFSRRR